MIVRAAEARAITFVTWGFGSNLYCGRGQEAPQAWSYTLPVMTLPCLSSCFSSTTAVAAGASTNLKAMKR